MELLDTIKDKMLISHAYLSIQIAKIIFYPYFIGS